MTIDLTTIRPLGERILVRRYEKPEKIGSIYLPDEARKDATQSLWEIVRASPEAESALGCALPADDILVTRPWRGLFIDDTHAFLDAREVLQVIHWQENEEE